MPQCTITHDKTADTYDFHLELHHGRQSNWNQLQSVLNVIKSLIPASDRIYDPSTKIWTIDAKFYEPVKAVAAGQGFQIKHKSDAEVKDAQAYANDFFYNHAPAAPEQKDVKAELEILLGVSVVTTSFDELKRAYRRKALELHPDRNNGDGSRMSELNSLWSMYNAK